MIFYSTGNLALKLSSKRVFTSLKLGVEYLDIAFRKLCMHDYNTSTLGKMTIGNPT